MKNILVMSVIFLAAIAFSVSQGQPSKTEGEMGEKGIVLTTMNSGNYTYVEIDKGGKKLWAAGPKANLKVGDTVILGPGSNMTKFYAKSLDRTFETIFFSGSITVEGRAPAATDAGAIPSPVVPKTTDLPEKGSIAKAKGGYTVDELFAKKTELNGKSVDIRGTVVKVNNNILGTNWYHLQDGTGEAGTNDMIVTSNDSIEAGKTVVAKGTLTIDKDFGSGYKYSVIIEDARFTVE